MKRSSVSWGAILLLAVATGDGSAADFLITNARVFTATQTGVIENANIVIDGERIVSVSADPPDTPSGARIDAGGMMVLPGLIDAHFHAFFDMDGASFPTSTPEARAYMNGGMREKLEAYLESGFTSLISPIDFWPFIVEVRNQVAAGALRGPRIFVAGGVLMAPGEHYVCGSRAWCNAHIATQINDAPQARSAVRRYAESGVDFIVYDSVTNAPEPKPEIVRAMIDEAHSRELRVFLHGADAGHAGRLLAWGIDGFVQPPSGTFENDDAALAQPGAPIPVGITNRSTEATRSNVMTLLRLGAVPVFASDMPGAPPRDVLPRMAQLLTHHGLSNAQVLQAATRHAAQELLGYADLGTIQPGQLADMIIVDGDPLIDLAALMKVEIVIKGGRIVVDKR